MAYDPYSPLSSRPMGFYDDPRMAGDYPTPLPAGRPSLTGMIMGDQTPVSDNITGAMSMIPGWGWIVGAAAAAKKATDNSTHPLGRATNKLLLPSIEEWYQNPVASFGNTVDPLGTAAHAAGAPKWASTAFIGPGPLLQGGK